MTRIRPLFKAGFRKLPKTAGGLVKKEKKKKTRKGETITGKRNLKNACHQMKFDKEKENIINRKRYIIEKIG